MSDKQVDDSSRYSIEGELGRGSMARVYSATDLRLGRPVAIKLIPEGLASDTQRVARLQREARALGKLNHPNIATIYSFEVTRSGSRLLILERVEGETLATRLRRGPLPLGDALQLADQIAAALEAAHERGVIHRDLKPSNVMVTPQGQVKVLDFGLAKITSDPGETPEAGEALDQTHGFTVGTPGYMSPEQVRGIEADRRSDLFAFGCVLYECLTGTRAFGGTPEQALGRALLREPSWSALPAETPAAVRELLEHCLEKSAEKRIGEAREVRARIVTILGSPPPGEKGTSAHPLSGTRRFPAPPTSFVGREKEIAEVLGLLESARLVTLTGPGGSGKTRLAVRIVEKMLEGYAGEVAWIDLAGIPEPERVPSAVAAALGVRELADTWILDTLEDHLAKRKALLVLDCCEHVLSACHGLANVLLMHAPRVTILATSREPLRVDGERVVAVPALPVAAPRPKRHRAPPDREMSPAARLFYDRAHALRPDLPDSGKDLDAVEEICRRLEGLPLAIELAAARARVLTPHEILAKLPDQLRLLAGGPPGAEPRHRALAATIRWSYDLLTREEQAFLRALSVFTGGWTLEASREVVGDRADEFQLLELHSRLIDKSLVVPEPSVGEQLRFRFLESVRHYALEELRRHGEESGVRARHLEHFVRVAERAAPELYGPDQGAWLERLEADHENILTALWWCRRAEGSLDAQALRIASRLWRFWFGQGLLELGRSVLRTVLALSGAKAPSADRSEALSGAGALAFHQNDYDDGFACYREALAIARERDDAVAAGFALGGLGNLHLSRGEYLDARAQYDSARGEFERAGHRRGEGLMVSNLGRLTELEGDVERAHELSGQGIAIFREVGDVGALALRLSSYAEESLRLGLRGEAHAHLTECLRVVQDLGEPHPGTYALERTAALLEAQGEPRVAARLCGAADSLRQRIASPHSPKEKTAFDGFLLRLQRSLRGKSFGEAWEEGRVLSFEGAIAEALRALESVTERTSAPHVGP